jgi:hypothetical protein
MSRNDSGPRVNRIEVNDEGVRLLIEIEGLPAIRAAQVMQAVLTLAFPESGAEHWRGAILDYARGGGGPKIEEPPGGLSG